MSVRDRIGRRFGTEGRVAGCGGRPRRPGEGYPPTLSEVARQPSHRVGGFRPVVSLRQYPCAGSASQGCNVRGIRPAGQPLHAGTGAGRHRRNAKTAPTPASPCDRPRGADSVTGGTRAILVARTPGPPAAILAASAFVCLGPWLPDFHVRAIPILGSLNALAWPPRKRAVESHVQRANLRWGCGLTEERGGANRGRAAAVLFPKPVRACPG